MEKLDSWIDTEYDINDSSQSSTYRGPGNTLKFIIFVKKFH